MATQVLEGTWEEIAARADELAGKRLRVIVETDALEAVESLNVGPPNIGPPNVGPPNEQALAILALIAERQQGRRETSGEDTQRLIREGRAGGVYGLEPIGD